MGKMTHQDHFVGAGAAFERAIGPPEQADRAEFLSVAIYHAAMASYVLATEVAPTAAAVIT